MLSLVHPSNPILWSPAQAVTDIQSQVIPHLTGMYELMVAKHGAGLAAPQVGIPFAFFICSPLLPRCHYSTVINPRILSIRGWNSSASEGCLTWPGRTTYVARRQIVEAEWSDETGALIKKTLAMGDARVFQHEYDHLAGVCIFPRPGEKG